jgi:thiol-disulfide isomerase/thioredoxin
MIMKKLSILILGLCSIAMVFAQKSGHKITIEAPQLANQEMFVAYHYGNKQYVKDTLVFDSKGKLAIQGEEKLQSGVYLAVFPKLNNKYFEFLVKEQFFGILLKDTNNLGSPTFINSNENTLFYADMSKMTEVRKESQQLEAQLKAAKEEDKEAIKTKLQDINTKFSDYRKQLMDDNKNLFYSDLLGMMREIEIPKPSLKEDEEKDENFQFQYFRTHYWDFTDFSEEGIVRTPVFHTKLIDYFDKYTYKRQDSLIVSCDNVLQKALSNKFVFQYALITLVNKYASSKVMGDDAVYVHLVKYYYETEDAWWIDEEQLTKMKERRIALEPLLIGKISPDLSLRDTTINRMISLHDIKEDYTILYIWDPECGHCKKATPKLGEFYKKHKSDNIMVYAITTSNIEELQKWKDFIKTHDLDWINVSDLYHQTNFRKIYDVTSTPQVFVLDKNKEIIAKRIGTEQLEGFFHRHLKLNGDERYINFILDDENAIIEEHDEHDGHDH